MSELTPSPEQQGILDLGLTSIRVRAGAGTGKTTTVAMVISNLVRNHDVEPEEILGITFTNKAAAELADRVRQTLGDRVEAGRQVEVHTYHGFAAQILSEFGALAGVDNRSKVITPTFSRQLLTDTFHHRSYQHLDITQTRTLDRIRRLGDRMGDHLLSPEHLLTYNHDPDDDIWEARVEMAETLADYSEHKNRLRVVDYADLVTLSTRIVTEHPELAAAIRDRYRAVVLDEYQDTNPAQRVLLTRVFSNGFPVIAVGDEDQTIYEWRGASAENFEQFTTHFPRSDGTAAHDRGLTFNRRSDTVILDVANMVRQRANPTSEPLTPLDTAGTGEITTYWARDALEEADWIARTFERLHEQGTPWSDMAVLFRKNKDFSVIVDALARHDIPVEVANIGGLLSVPEVSELRAWLTALERPRDSSAVTQILFGSKFRLGMADIAPLTRIAAKDEATGSEDLDPITLVEVIEVLDQVTGLRPEARKMINRFAAVYREVLIESQGLTLVETLRLILDQTRAWQDIDALPPNQRLTARLNVFRLLDLAEDWSPLEGRPSVGAFLDYLETMEDEPADELDSARLSGEEAVTLVTVHRAKGLEWDTVAIPAVTKGNFPSRSQQHPDPVRFAEHLPHEMRIDRYIESLPQDKDERTAYLRAKHDSQEWRVAYVALTRAKKRLLVSGAYWYGLPEPTQTPKEQSELFELVAGHPNTASEGEAPLSKRPATLRAPMGDRSPDPLFEHGWPDALREAMSDPEAMPALARRLGLKDDYNSVVDETTQRLFRLAELTPEQPDPEESPSVSVTSLVTMAQCPKRYYWTDVDPLPRKPNPAAVRGTEVHRRIELHQRGQVPFEDMADDLYDIADGEGGPGAYQAYLDSSYANRRADLIEAPFGIELDNGFRVRGRIDAVYCDDQSWEVVDFKSGKPSQDEARLVQLQAYAVAVSKVDFGRPAPANLEVAFAYLGGGLEVDSYKADETWVRSARSRLDQLTDAILEESFEAQPSNWCRGCDFLMFCEEGQQQVAE